VGEAALATASAGGGGSLGVALALGGAAFSAGSYITIRKLRATDDPWVITLYFTLVAVPLALPSALQYGRWPTSTEWVWLAVVGLCTQVGQILGAYGLHKLPAGPAVALGYAQVAFAFGWGVLLFDEPIRALSVFGATLVFGGVLVIGASVRARVRAESPPMRPAPTGPQLSRPADRPVPRVE
jgi:drug/metabolite transporter (DMT)-like permease